LKQLVYLNIAGADCTAGSSIRRSEEQEGYYWRLVIWLNWPEKDFLIPHRIIASCHWFNCRESEQH